MPYQGKIQSIIYPDESNKPCVMHYRIAFTVREPWLVIIQLQQDNDAYASPVVSSDVRDQVLNRILENDLRGIRVADVRLVAGDSTGVFEYELTPDIEDYVARGNCVKATVQRARRGRFVEQIEVTSDQLTCGRMRVGTAHATSAPLSRVVAEALS